MTTSANAILSSSQPLSPGTQTIPTNSKTIKMNFQALRKKTPSSSPPTTTISPSSAAPTTTTTTAAPTTTTTTAVPTTTTIVQLPLTAQQSQALNNAAAADSLSKSSSSSFTIQDIAIAAIVTSLGFVLASFWRDAIQTTVKTVLPTKERKWYTSYIIAAVITFILAIIIYLIIQLTNYKNKKVLEKIGFESSSSGELGSTPTTSTTPTTQTISGSTTSFAT